MEERKHMDKAMRGGLMKLVLMRAIARANDYPYAMLKALRCHKHLPFGAVTKNEVYNALNALEKRGYMRSKSILAKGKVQKHYTLTAQGRSVVRRSRRIILQLIKEMKLLVSEFDG